MQHLYLVDPHGRPLGGWDDVFSVDTLGDIVDYLSEGRRGQALTTALTLAGYAEDDVALQRVYETHEDAINAYLDQVAVSKLVQDLVTGDRAPVQLSPDTALLWAKANAGPLAAGALAGYLLGKLL